MGTVASRLKNVISPSSRLMRFMRFVNSSSASCAVLPYPCILYGSEWLTATMQSARYPSTIFAILCRFDCVYDMVCIISCFGLKVEISPLPVYFVHCDKRLKMEKDCGCILLDAKEFPGEGFLNLRGDPSLRETALSRPKYGSDFDEFRNVALGACRYLLEETDVHSLTLSCMSGTVIARTLSDPFGFEIHKIKSFMSKRYLPEKFKRMALGRKMALIERLGEMTECLISGHSNLLEDNPEISECKENPFVSSPELVSTVLAEISKMRDQDMLYLRDAHISIPYAAVRMSFNCDGTYFVSADKLQSFVAENFAS